MRVRISNQALVGDLVHYLRLLGYLAVKKPGL
jgi:hypothetical protein